MIDLLVYPLAHWTVKPATKSFWDFLGRQTGVSVEEENKSLRFLGLANTPLANASLEGGGRVGFKPELGSRQGSWGGELCFTEPKKYIHRTKEIHLQNQGNTFTKPEEYRCITWGGRVGFKAEPGAGKLKKCVVQNLISTFSESENSIYRIKETHCHNLRNTFTRIRET